MIKTEFKKLYVTTDGEEVTLKIEGDDLNLCHLNAIQTNQLINALIEASERLEDRKTELEYIMRTTDFTRMYEEFELKYNPYPIQMSRMDAFRHALNDGLIDKDTFAAAEKYYGKLWCYVGD